RIIEARLTDREGKVWDTARTTVIFDGTPPRNVRFLDLPPRVRKDQPLAVRATCDLPVSGIREVKFFVGKPVNNAPPPAPPPVPGQLVDPKANLWRASLPFGALTGDV